MIEVMNGYQDDQATLEMIAKLSIDPVAIPGFSLHNGILKLHNRIWVGSNPPLQDKLLKACHASAIGGHSGIPVTYRRMKKLFAWKGMKADVVQFVSTCLTCQQAKSDRAKLPGKLQPLPVPDSAWQIISMDFVEGLPSSGHANCILVVVDSFTKYAHFIPLHHPYTTASVAKLFLNNVYKYHGMPSSIVSDRDRVFNSKLWRELFSLAGVQLQMSSSYHPQYDGQTERVNQTMETFLRCFVNTCPSKWLNWLHLAEFWYNSCDHSAIGRSPFEALYGYTPRHFGI
jgi:transposase InsO family protein